MRKILVKIKSNNKNFSILSNDKDIPIVIKEKNNYQTNYYIKKNQSIIIKKNLECQPCLQRTCPLNHNNCMKLIEASEVLDAVESIN